MRELERYRAAVRELPAGCREAEAQAERQEKLSVDFSEGKPGAMSLCGQTELFVRASSEGKTGMVYTQKLDDDPREVIAQALKNSEVSQSGGREPMASPRLWEELARGEAAAAADSREAGAAAGLRKSGGVLAAEKADPSLRLVETQELTAFAGRLEREIQEKSGTKEPLRISVGQTILTMGLVNSLGLDVSAATGRFEAEVSGENGYAGFLSARSLEEIDAGYFAEGLRERKFTEQPLVPARAGVYRAVLSSQAVNNILITAWQMFTGRRAANGTTPFAEKIGSRIFSPCVTIEDVKGAYPGVRNGYSWELDCEGVPSRDTLLVKDGVLTGWMHNLSSAQSLGEAPTGNAGRKTLLSGNIHTDMLIMPKNFTLREGNASLEELFSACGDGIYIYENYDQFHALNVVTGDFAFPCRGIVIRGGKPAGRMEGLTMNGNVRGLFAGVELLGREREICPLVMYSSYTVSGPAMLVKELKIVG